MISKSKVKGAISETLVAPNGTSIFRQTGSTNPDSVLKVVLFTKSTLLGFLTLVHLFVHFSFVVLIILPVFMLTALSLAQVCIFIGMLIFHPHFL